LSAASSGISLVASRLTQHRLLRGLQYALKAPQEREWKDDAPILALLEIAPEKVCDRPDEGCCSAEGVG
jgi:hypothetical protein